MTSGDGKLNERCGCLTSRAFQEKSPVLELTFNDTDANL
jgi:hypothetical protein